MEYVKTSEMAKLIAEVHGKRIRLTKKGFSPILETMIPRFGLVNKVFGNLACNRDVSIYRETYQIGDLKSL